MDPGAGDLKGVEHFAGFAVVNPVGGEAGEHHGGRLEDGLGVAKGVEDAGAVAGSGAGSAAAATAGFLVVVAEGAVDEGGRLAEEAVGFGVAAEGIGGGAGHHGSLSGGLNAAGRT